MESKQKNIYAVSGQIRIVISIIYMISIFLAYMLMLVVMTYNAGLFIATVVGLTAGYAIFGFIKKKSHTRIYNPEGDKCCTEVDG